MLEAAELAEASARAAGSRDGVWWDASGAGVAVSLAPGPGPVECARPTFRSERTLLVRVAGLARDPACVYCSRLLVELVDDGGEQVGALALELENVVEVLERPALAGPAVVRLAAFAEDLETWPDEEAYYAPPEGDARLLAAQSFLPVGVFTEFAGDSLRRWWRRRRRAEPPPARAHAMITGPVGETRALRNSLTGREFSAAVVDSVFAFELVAPAGAFPEANGIVQAMCWLVGRADRR